MGTTTRTPESYAPKNPRVARVRGRRARAVQLGDHETATAAAVELKGIRVAGVIREAAARLAELDVPDVDDRIAAEVAAAGPLPDDFADRITQIVRSAALSTTLDVMRAVAA